MKRYRRDGSHEPGHHDPVLPAVDEGEKVLAEMAKNGLVRGKNGLEVYVMCEIPNNILLIDEFSRLFDGFSIGSNDLTQLTFGVTGTLDRPRLR